uniref:Ovule protein n=1 Tax=Caenorhabditis tropicalis TaxID=1561998 RepID=A0A1I7TBQ7_9PELO
MSETCSFCFNVSTLPFGFSRASASSQTYPTFQAQIHNSSCLLTAPSSVIIIIIALFNYLFYVNGKLF